MGSGASSNTSSNFYPLIKSKSILFDSIVSKELKNQFGYKTTASNSHYNSIDNEDNNHNINQLESFRKFDLNPLTFRRNKTRDGKCTPVDSELEQNSSYIRPDDRIISVSNSKDFLDKLTNINNKSKRKNNLKIIKTDFNLSITNDDDESIRRFTVQPCDYSSLTELKTQASSQFHDVQMCCPNEDDAYLIGSCDYKHVCTLCELEFDTNLVFVDHINLSKIHMVKLLEFEKRRRNS